MEIIKTGIIRVASLGSISMQVINFLIPLPGYVLTEEEKATISIPDEWMMMLDGHKPCVGKKVGHLYLTKAGWNANKQEIKQAFEKAITEGWVKNGSTWADYVKFAHNHFQEVDRKKNSMIKKLEAQLNDLKNLKI